MKCPLTFFLMVLAFFNGYAHQKDPMAIYEEFKQSAQQNYNSFLNECNQKYADFLRTAWDWYQGKAPMPAPKENNPIPPRPYESIDDIPIAVQPIPVKPVEPKPQPKPVSPIKESPNPIERTVTVKFYGITPTIRLLQVDSLNLKNVSPNSLAKAWETLSTESMNNTIRDCLETRIRYNLCDWAYLQFLRELATQYCSDNNTATLLAAFLYCQSGYQMRLGDDNGNLVMLVGSDHFIYERPYFNIDSTHFYPLDKTSGNIKICNATFEGETPMSLFITQEQLLGSKTSEERLIKSKRYNDINTISTVPLDLINFYNTYPTSVIGDNPLSRWAMYADTPLAGKTKELLYASLKKSNESTSEIEIANKLLNWVQTGFVYELDDVVWGQDRAFFAEETLYYPYADCEDRSILFSRLVRDLLGLDVALIYYPGHLATAVKFNTDVKGDAMIIDGKKYIVCDPTYIGAPVGKQMPDLEYDKAEAILLRR